MDMRLQGAGPTHPDSYRCNREIWRLSWFCMVAYIIALMWCSAVLINLCAYPSHPGSTHYTYHSIYPLHLVSYPIISILLLLYLVILYFIHLLTPSAFMPTVSCTLWIYTYPISMGIYRLSTISCSTLIYLGTISRIYPISCILSRLSWYILYLPYISWLS